MSRLIDADALKENMGEQPLNWNNSPEEIQETFDWNKFTQLIDEAPTIDAVEVVRCKNCRYGHAIQMLGETCWDCGLTGHVTTANGYCDKGVKRHEAD